MTKTWITPILGMPEGDFKKVRRSMVKEEERLLTLTGDYQCGRLTTPNMKTVRMSGRSFEDWVCTNHSEVTANVSDLIRDPANEGAWFMAASQLNCLEMISPDITPEDGIGCYAQDFTQGPAVAMATGAATLARNYLYQTPNNQINLGAYLFRALSEMTGAQFPVINGYALPSGKALMAAADYLNACSPNDIWSLMESIQIGLHRRAGVTDRQHTVNLSLCSAMPVAYSGLAPELWKPLAMLFLKASYISTLAAAHFDARTGGSNVVYLTWLGGGAFGNPQAWIVEALWYALDQFEFAGLDVRMVNYG